MVKVAPLDLINGFSGDEVDELLAYAYENGASDTTFQTGQPVWAKIHGQLLRLTRRKLQKSELELIANHLYKGSGAVSFLMGGKYIDTRCELIRGRGHRIGFRVNMTACYIPGGIGIQVTARSLPGTPPTLEELSVEKEIVDNINPLSGLVLVVGITGDGKSTLLASAVRHKLENKHNRKIITYEDPIEFVYDGIEGASSFICQTEIGTHLKAKDSESSSFGHGIRNALRRDPEDILVGELRDRETFEAAIDATLSGHTTYGTLHVNTVEGVIPRLIRQFPEEIREAVTFDLVDCLRLVIAQKLVINTSGTRTALREYLVFDSRLREHLQQFDYRKIPQEIRKTVRARGTSMLDAAQKAHHKGIIDDKTLSVFEREFGYGS